MVRYIGTLRNDLTYKSLWCQGILDHWTDCILQSPKETEKIISQVKDKNKVVVSNSVRKNSDGNASPESEVADNIEAEDSEPEETYL